MPVVPAIADALFVYGTLRRGAAHPMHAVLRDGSQPLGAARVRGRLYDLGRNPGIVLDPEAAWVHGELYRLRDRAVLAALDRYEGAAPEDPAPREYERIVAAVELLATGNPCPAWIYEYRWPIANARPVHGGDYLAWSGSG